MISVIMYEIKYQGDIVDMEQLTIKELLKYCQREVANGNGNKHIVVSDDNEGNGFHGLFYEFTELTDADAALIYDSNYNSPEDTIILG